MESEAGFASTLAEMEVGVSNSMGGVSSKHWSSNKSHGGVDAEQRSIEKEQKIDQRAEYCVLQYQLQYRVEWRRQNRWCLEQ